MYVARENLNFIFFTRLSDNPTKFAEYFFSPVIWNASSGCPYVMHSCWALHSAPLIHCLALPAPTPTVPTEWWASISSKLSLAYLLFQAFLGYSWTVVLPSEFQAFLSSSQKIQLRFWLELQFALYFISGELLSLQYWAPLLIRRLIYSRPLWVLE